MFCKNCGQEIQDGINECPNCGAVQTNESNESAPVTVEPAKKSNVLVVSIILCVVGSVASLFIPLIGYVCGAGCLGMGAKAKKQGDSKAKVATILGIVCLVISLASHIIGAIMISGRI